MLHYVYFGFHTGHKQQSLALVLPNHHSFTNVIITVATAGQGTPVCVIKGRCLSVVYNAVVNEE